MRKALWVMGAIAISSAAVQAAVTKSQASRLREASIVLHEIHQAPDKDAPSELWEKAECIAVFPSVKKAAFIVGGEDGKGVMSCRHGADWSAPAFMSLQKGSGGSMIGGEAVDLVLLVMNDHGVNTAAPGQSRTGRRSVGRGRTGRPRRPRHD